MAKTAVSWMLVSNSNSAFMKTVHTVLSNLFYSKPKNFVRDLPFAMFHPELKIGDIIVDNTGAYEVLEIQEKMPDEVYGDTLKTYRFKKIK